MYICIFHVCKLFLSIQAQDFIEEDHVLVVKLLGVDIPEHSSSGLH